MTMLRDFLKLNFCDVQLVRSRPSDSKLFVKADLRRTRHLVCIFCSVGK